MTGKKKLSDRIAAWDRIVAAIEAGYGFDLDNWLNDMDLRRTIDDGLEALTPRHHRPDKESMDRLAASDRRFLRATVGAGKCLWGSAAAKREGWHADRQWWYFRKPRRSNAELAHDIDKVT